jgi:hypothetical protein
MKLGLFLVISLLVTSCTSSELSSSIEGVWVWEDVDQVSGTASLKKHVLSFNEKNDGAFSEEVYINGEKEDVQEGILLLHQAKNKVSSKKNVYEGELLGNQLMISSINGTKLQPPALYTKK